MGMSVRKLVQSVSKNVFDCSRCTNNQYCEHIKRFQEIVENSVTGIGIVQDDKVVYLNTEQQRMAGMMLKVGDILPFEYVHPDDVALVKDKYEKACRGEIRNVDVDYRCFVSENAGGPVQMKWVKSRGCIIQYKGRNALLLNTIDVTSAHKLERMVAIEDKMATLGRMAAGLAHEIRNPLSGINIYLTMLKKITENGEGIQKLPEIIARMDEASHRINAVIRRIMDFSKPSEPKFIMTGINGPIEDAIGLAAVTLRKACIKIETRLASIKGVCRLDPYMIEQVLLNLITNAAEAMQGKSDSKLIVISSSIERRYAVVRVADNGPGIPPDQHVKIFEPFYTTKADSTGIGLSLCSRMITDHYGTLRVEDSRLGGAEFVIEIPLVDEGTS